MNPREIPQDFEDFAKVAKFRQIWSHCLPIRFQRLWRSLLMLSFSMMPKIGAKLERRED